MNLRALAVQAMLIITGMVLAATAQGQAPAGSTGECKDGTYTSASSKRGACSGHGGVKEWYAESKTPAAAPAPAATPSKSTARSTETPTPAAGGAGSTGECKDGTYTSASSKRGACSGHGGVKEWYADSKTPAAAAPPVKSTAAPPAPAAAPSKSSARSTEMPTTAAAGGGPGKVWVNTSSKVYHCPNDRWYGKTKNGEYMSEAEAKAAGNHPDHGKACS